MVVIPLQFGNGNYKVRVAKEINNTGSYGVVFSKEINVSVNDSLMVYKASITEVFWTEEMAAIVFAYERTSDASYEWDMVVSIYEYIVKQYRYDYEKINSIVGMRPGYIPDIEVVFYDRRIICHDYSVLFASMLRSLDIPCKLIKGYCENTEGYHAWNEVYNPDTGKWVVMDLTYDAAYDDWGYDYEMEKNPDIYYPNEVF
jgi:transglutaminase-like putative cysteine protease